MSKTKVMIIVAFVFVTIKTTIGEYPPEKCSCFTTGQYHNLCVNRGCSLGTNHACNDGTFADNHDTGILESIMFDDGFANGCNCPSSSSTATYNGYYHDGHSEASVGYNYDSCTGFGGNARRRSGEIPAGANDVVDCCNFCCNRTDPYPTTTSTSTIITTTILRTTTTAINTARNIVSNRILCLTVLSIFILMTIEIN